MAAVAEIIVPAPPDLTTGPEGAQTIGQAYTLGMPALSTDALRVTDRMGRTFTWAPAEVAYRDTDAAGTAHYDFVVGSAPVSVSTDRRTARYARMFPNSEDVFLAEPELVKHWTILNALPRSPGVGMNPETCWLGVSGIVTVTGARLPVGVFETLAISGFSFDRPPAWALGAETHGWYEVLDNVDGSQTLFVWFNYQWFLEHPGPWHLDPTVITGTAGETGNSNGHSVGRLSNGNLVAVIGTGSQLVLRYSADSGTTWSTPTSGAVVFGSSDPATLDVGTDDTLYVVFGSVNLRKIVGTPSNGGTAWTWGAPSSLGGATARQPCTVVHAEGAGIVQHLWWSENISGDLYIQGEVSAGPYFNSGSRQSCPVGLVAPDKTRHTIWSTGATGSGLGIRYRRDPYSGGTWTAGTVATVDQNNYVGPAGSEVIAGALDSQGRPVVVYRASGDNVLHVKRRSSGGTSGSWSELTGIPAITATSVAIVCKTDDIYVVFTDGAGVGYTWWAAADSTWRTITRVSTDATAKGVNIKDDISGGGIHGVFVTGSASPYTIQSFLISLNSPPLEPTLTVSPAAIDASYGTDITIEQHDGDPGNTMVAYALKRVLGAVTEWWNATTKLWVGSETFNAVAGSVTSTTIAAADNAGKWVNGNTYQLFAATRDNAGATGPYQSVAVPVLVAQAPVCTLVSPADEGTVPGSSATLTWAVASGTQASYQAKLVAADVDPATAAALGSSDTGEQAGTAAARTIAYTGANGERVRGAVRIKNTDGVWSAWVAADFTFAYAPPPAPTLAVTPSAATATTALQATVPAPGGGEVAAVSVRFEASCDAGATVREVATAALSGGTASATDYAAPHGTCQYRAVAIAASGVETTGAWVDSYLPISYWWFIPQDGANAVVFAYGDSLRWRPEQDIDVPAIMDVYRREEAGPTFARLADISATFAERDGLTARQWRERCLAHAQNGTAGYLKGPVGDVYLGTMRVAGWATNLPSTWEGLQLTFRQTGEVG